MNPLHQTNKSVCKPISANFKSLTEVYDNRDNYRVDRSMGLGGLDHLGGSSLHSRPTSSSFRQCLVTHSQPWSFPPLPVSP